ncbi:protein ITPRID1 [Falco naumanni]|uniref:protein ITPRID1 n=1 Tax=Falco naumanni TaxID=148594 RepID=UPI001ADE7D6B|nr:protein ITPRID1 [Falco naumanni]
MCEMAHVALPGGAKFVQVTSLTRFWFDRGKKVNTFHCCFFLTRSLQEFSESPVMPRCKSLSSSHSFTGAPKSITEWLSLWEKDPVEILLDLGFGTEEPDVCTKIPPRFLSGASVAKGINIRVFLEAQKQRMDVERPNLYERFRQLEVLDHVTSALSSLLTDVNTQQTKAQDARGDEIGLLDAAKSRPVVTQAKRRRLGQLLKRASRQTMLLEQGLPAPGETNLHSRKEQPCSCADIVGSGTVQTRFPACVTLGCLAQEPTTRDRGASAYPISQCPPAPLRKAWASSHLVAKQPHLSPACEVPAKDGPRKEPPSLVAHMLQKVANLKCKLPDSFEMEEIQSFEDEDPCRNPPDTTSAEVMVRRTSSCQSDSSGFMEELPEPVVLQNATSSGKINFISDIHNQETALSHRTVFPMLNQGFQQNPDNCVAEGFITACESILAVPTSTKACNDHGGETHLLLTAENSMYQTCNAEPQSFVQEILHHMGKKDDKTERKQLGKERCMKEHSPCFQGDTPGKGGPSSSKFDCNLYFSTGHEKVHVTFAELNDINPAVVSESKIRAEDEGERCRTEKDIGGVACHGSAHRDHTGHGQRLWWGVEAISKDGTPLAVNEITDGQKSCKMDGDSRNARCSPKIGLPEILQWGSAAQGGSSAASSCSLQVSRRHPSCLEGGPRLKSSEGEKTGSIEVLGANKSEQGDTIQTSEIASAPSKSVTVQMSSGLEFTSRATSAGQNAPFSESLAREDPADFSDTLACCPEGGPLLQSDPGAPRNGLKQTTEASTQTDTLTRKPRWSRPCSPHTPLTKSASLDSMLYRKYRSHYWGEASGFASLQPELHRCHCCCCCCGCCPWTWPAAAFPHRPASCCSSPAAAELQVPKAPVLLQDTATCRLAPCTLHEIEAMKSSCQRFQEKLDEIEQHLSKQQALFSSSMLDEEREEGRHLQLLRTAVRQEVAELEFWLNDQACQVKESILMQLDQLLAEQSHLFSELGLSDWKGERKAQNKQAFPDAADTVHPQSGCFKMVLQRAPSKTMTATGSLSALAPGAPSVQFPTRTTPEPNSAESAPQELSSSKKEIKGPPQAQMDFKAFMHSVRSCFGLTLKV